MNHKIMMSAAMVALMLVSCKPTENNYKAAYDAALAKREAAAKEQMLPATGLMSDDGPQLRIIDGDSVFVLMERVFPEGERRAVKGWSVAVGKYKMSTNAKAGADAIRAKLHRAGVADSLARAVRATSDRWYTLVGTYSTLDSARIRAASFRKDNPRYPYVGLPHSPILIFH